MTTPLISTIVPTFFCSAMGLLERLGLRYEDGAPAPEERGHPTRATRPHSPLPSRAVRSSDAASLAAWSRCQQCDTVEGQVNTHTA